MIYVDKLRPCQPNTNWRYSWVSHLTTDGDVEELHAFAKLIGLKREWFQDGKHPHYDIVGKKRFKALQWGAKQRQLSERKGKMSLEHKVAIVLPRTDEVTLSKLLGIQLYEMHEAMDILGWDYVKHPEEERTSDITCCYGNNVMLRGVVGVDTAQCLHCDKLMQNMAGIVPLTSGTVGWIEDDMFINDGQVWLPVTKETDMRHLVELPMWSKKACLPM